MDVDGDDITCRWATRDEAQAGTHNLTTFGSITLDPKTCILTYDGTRDMATSGVKLGFELSTYFLSFFRVFNFSYF